MLSNAYSLAKFRFDTAENERNFAENLPKTDNYPTGPLPRSAVSGRSPWLRSKWLRQRAVLVRIRGDDRSVKIKSLEAAKITKIKWLVLGCIGADLCKQIRVLLHFSKSTRLSSWHFEIRPKFADFTTFAFFLLNFHENCWFFQPIFAKILRLLRCKRMLIL